MANKSTLAKVNCLPGSVEMASESNKTILQQVGRLGVKEAIRLWDF